MNQVRANVAHRGNPTHTESKHYASLERQPSGKVATLARCNAIEWQRNKSATRYQPWYDRPLDVDPAAILRLEHVRGDPRQNNVRHEEFRIEFARNYNMACAWFHRPMGTTFEQFATEVRRATSSARPEPVADRPV